MSGFRSSREDRLFRLSGRRRGRRGCRWYLKRLSLKEDAYTESWRMSDESPAKEGGRVCRAVERTSVNLRRREAGEAGQEWETEEPESTWVGLSGRSRVTGSRKSQGPDPRV